MIYNRINITPTVLPIASILNDIENVSANGLDLSPDYQRGYIWDQEYKEKLILSLVLNYPIGNIVINQLSTPNKRNAKSELVDGKQRLTTISDFCNDDLLIRGKNASEIQQTVEKIINNSDDEDLKKFMKKHSFRFKDLPKSIASNIKNYVVPVYTMMAADSLQIREYFKVLQNQDKLRAGEIINAIEDNLLSEYFDEIGYDFLKVLGYEKLKRAEFEKIYYSVCATLLGKLPLNVLDKQIVKYVESLKELSKEDKDALASMNDNLKYINKLQQGVIKLKMSKRSLKMILGIAAFNPGFFKENAINKLIFIIEFSNKLAAFNTSESDEVSFTRYYQDEYVGQKDDFMEKKAPLYREIYNVSSRSTAPREFEKQMKKIPTLFLDI